MLSGVGVICFVGSYAVALALVVLRLRWANRLPGALVAAAVGAGLVAHSAFLYHRAADGTGTPLSSDRDWFLVAAWLVVAAYAFLACCHPRVPSGLFLLPLALGLVAAGLLLASPEPYARAAASHAWGIVHGASIVLAIVAVALGFVAGLMYLGQARRLKSKLPARQAIGLPSLEWLERANGRSLVVATAMMAVGVASGMLLNRIRARGPAGPLPWSDPLVLATTVMLAWLLLAVVIGAIHRSAPQGRKVAYLTLASFVFLLIALGVGLLLGSQHGGARSEGSGVRGRGLGVGGWGFRKPRHCGGGEQRERFRISDLGFQLAHSRFGTDGQPASLHHSITPSLHHSITPSLHHSITPPLPAAILPARACAHFHTRNLPPTFVT